MFRRTTGTPGADLAKLCFAENLAKFKGDTEKDNLYHGLEQLALSMQQMQAQIEKIKREILQIRHDQSWKR